MQRCKMGATIEGGTTEVVVLLAQAKLFSEGWGALLNQELPECYFVSFLFCDMHTYIYLLYLRGQWRRVAHFFFFILLL